MNGLVNTSVDQDKLADAMLMKLSDPIRACELRRIASGGMDQYDPYTRMRPREIAKALRIDVAEIYDAIKRNLIRFQLIGNSERGQYRILYKDVVDYQESRIYAKKAKQKREIKI